MDSHSEPNPFASPATISQTPTATATGPGYIADLSPLDAYGKGWTMIFASFGTFLGVVLLHWVIRMPTDQVDSVMPYVDRETAIAIYIASVLYGLLVAAPIAMSVAWVFLKGARQERLQISDMFAVFQRNYWVAVGAGILKVVILILGFVALIIPGIIFACRLSFMEYLIVDRKMGVFESMRTSWEMTRGDRFWTILAMYLLAIPIGIVGLLALCVGVFVSIMWITGAFAVLYHSCSVRDGLAQREEEPFGRQMPDDRFAME